MNPCVSTRPYRVRLVKPPEQSVPDDSEAAHFGTLEAARTYARSLGAQCGGRVVVERRSAGGCWLCLAELG